MMEGEIDIDIDIDIDIESELGDGQEVRVSKGNTG